MSGNGPHGVVAVEDLRRHLAPGARLLGIDLGEKRIGLAISDSGLTVASPLETLPKAKFTLTAERIEAIAAERGVGGLVVGLPVNMDGTEGPRCQSARQFARNLVQRGFDKPIAFWDERLSTAAIERVLIGEADMSRHRRREVVDKMAAAYILQGALERLRHD